ncbi:MAG TPA: DNA polymerase I [Gemmataceae bacterium]|nr:DNA polymerase I [Gemmataceae bacterium]
MYLVDAHSLIFQVFHAIPEMSSPSGLPTNALYGFTRDMLYLRTEKKPDYLVAVLDRPGKTFRDALYPEYKAHRAPAPDDLHAQIPLICQALEAMRIPVLGVDGFEADDVIATVATAAAQRGIEVFVCTTDKDCRQLINDHVRLFNLRKHALLDREGLLHDWGIRPEQVVDLQTLVGDSVDNVPGVRGIGLKTAAKLLADFGTLDQLIAECRSGEGATPSKNKIRSAILTNLREAIDNGSLELSRKLVRLATDVPVEIDWEGWRLREWDAPRLLALFQGWGFRSFADQVRRQTPEASVSVESAGDNGQLAADHLRQGELFPFGANVAENAPAGSLGSSGQGKYHLVDTKAKFTEFFRQLRQQRRIAVDLETTGLDPIRSQIVGFAFAWQPGEAWYVPVRGPKGEAVLGLERTLTELAKVLEDPKIAKVNQNIKYDFLVLRANGVLLQGVAGDPMLADYLLHAGERSHNLADLSSRYLNHQVIPITDLIGKGKNQITMDQVPTARVAEYSGEDADMAWRLAERLEPELRETGLSDLYEQLEVPLIAVLAELEFNGIRIDVPLLQRLSQEMTKQLAGIEEEIYALAGRRFNIASPKQLREVLFKEQRLPTQRKTGVSGEASTDQATLERLALLGHELPKRILEHRQIAKLKGTYVDALSELMNPATGRIHASFNQTVTATGRLSSSDPNLQNIPVRTEQGRQIRQAFLPAEGWRLLTADYSQIELRLLAHFSGDEALRRAFAEDRDIHTAVAAQIFGVAEPEVNSAMRRMAKTVNFGVVYGMSAHGLAERLGIARDEAARFIDAYFARYPKVQEYQAKLLAACQRQRYVSTILGRRREITGIRADSTYQQRNQPEREAINMEIQGSAADLIKMAMLNIYGRVQKDRLKARMLLQIHDELVFEVPPEEVDRLVPLVCEEMTTRLERKLRLDVPLKVDVAVGPNWLDVEEVEGVEMVKQ